MKICVIGTGYVGLVTGTGFAETGNDVVCADIDESKIEKLERGEPVIYEPGLDQMIARNVEQGRLAFSADVADSIRDADGIFIAVGTPPREDGAADLSAVDAVAETTARTVKRQTALICKSTVPVGTNARVRRIVRGITDQKISVISNPEFLKEGAAVNDFMRPDRIVVGCDADDEYARDLMRRLYHPLTLSGERIVWMDPASAELTKYVSNTMLAMRISFMNEVAVLCDRVGADVNKVRKGVGSDSRIGTKFLYAGPGYGGSCFPKDVQALVHTAHEHAIDLELASATDRVNRRHKGVLLRKLKHHLSEDLRGKKVAVWGIAFKPRTDDIREAPAITLIDSLLAEGATVSAHDPEAAENARERFGDRIEMVDDPYQAVKDADALVLVTEWRAYQNPDFDRVKSLLRNPLLIDGRNIWSAYDLNRQGFTYDGIGSRGS
jgi:UDPglucose 6-dehydrogenase